MPARLPELYLQEELLLIVLNDAEGTVNHRAATYAYALGGALLGELLLTGRLSLDLQKRKTFVAVANTLPVGEPVLDECLQRIRSATRRATLETWISRFAQLSKLRHRVARGLCTRGVLRETEDTILLFFTRRRYPERDHRYEERLLERVRQAVLGDGELEPRTALLVALASAAGLLRIVFSKPELKARRARIKQITEGQPLGRSTHAAVQAACAAATAACIAASAG